MITEILSKVLPVLVMIALGRLCETKQIINDEQHAGLKAIVGDILLPVVLFQAFFTADYGKRMLLVFVLVFVGYGAALAAGYALRRFVKPYDRFMPLLMTGAEGGMLGYALYARSRRGSDQDVRDGRYRSDDVRLYRLFDGAQGGGRRKDDAQVHRQKHADQ